MLKHLLTGSKEPSAAGSSGIRWNAAAGIVNAGQSIVMLMIVSRINSIEDAGNLTFAFAVANLLLAVGKFGIRNFQVTDVNNDFSPHEYIYSRFITASLMACIAAGVALFSFFSGQYTLSKSGVILLLCLIYSVEAVEDAFTGYFQKAGRLDVYGKVFVFRWFSIFICFGAGNLLLRNVAASLVFALFASSLLDCVMLRLCFYAIHPGGKSVSARNISKLLRTTAPLFGVAFLSLLLLNAPKYAIDRYLSAELQAYFGFVSMPVFAIGLMSAFFYQPALVAMAGQWNAGQREAFLGHVRKQLSTIAVIACACTLLAYFLGIPVLSLLYHTDLHPYRAELMIMMLGGCSLAFANYFSAVLTIMRRQRKLLAGYIATAAVAFPVSYLAVFYWGIRGAALASCALISALALAFAVVFILYSKLTFERSA